MILFSGYIGSNLSSLLTAAIISLLFSISLSLDIDWDIPTNAKPYEPLTATVGDTITFRFQSNSHNVLIYPSGNCDDTDSIFLGKTNPVKYTFEKRGVYTFACSVSGGAHCRAGQIIDITINDASSSDQNEDGSDAIEDEEEESNDLPIYEEGDKDKVLEKYKDYFNPGEEMGLLEFRTKPYKIPRKTTTYVDFVFNLPDDVPDIVHIVIGDVVNSQPKHLHHLVMNGCTESIDPSQEGLPLDNPPWNCNIPLGGWAVGGNLYGGMSLNSGHIFGSGLGIKAYSLNIHYTDGQAIGANYANDGKNAIATDGVRILYTPTLRPQTVLLKTLINIGTGPADMNVPPNVPRYFYTKTCTVEPACQDTSAEVMKQYSLAYTCETHKHLCYLATGFTLRIVQMLCPEACSLCSTSDDNINKKDSNSTEYHVSAIFYHAHVIGREMYTTLLPKSTAAPIDLESKDLWLYDYQVAYPLQNDQDDKPYFKVYPGDKIQATCVYDSTSRQENTYFDISTYDEMCITQLHVLVDTPEITATNAQSLLTMLNLKSFACAIDESSDIWGGSLEADEDGRNIWKDHPVAEADCTFPVGVSFGRGLSERGDTIPNFETKCKRDDSSDNTVIAIEDVCDKNEGIVFDQYHVAGKNCEGGKLDGADSNDPSSYSEFGTGTFEENCTTNGGQHSKYTCQNLLDYVNYFVQSESEKSYLKIFMQQQCCIDEDGDLSSNDNESSSGDTDTDVDTDVDTDFTICATTRCPHVMLTSYPQGWGNDKDADLASIVADNKIASAVDCVCTFCKTYDEIEMWPANTNNEACDLADGKYELSPYHKCLEEKCPGTLESPTPSGWGGLPSYDIEIIKSDELRAGYVHCECQNCADFDEHKTWPANADGKACDIAEDEVKTSFNSCLNGYCPGLITSVPDNWGQNAEKDVVMVKADPLWAKHVNCACKQCGDFEEITYYESNENGELCAIANSLLSDATSSDETSYTSSEGSSSNTTSSEVDKKSSDGNSSDAPYFNHTSGATLIFTLIVVFCFA